ncbi:MAG: hypothetical protein A3C30_03180 [Candidatus Levybacteria bacterium RIFCSPHIGHO2_02_FULL_40_18]|nr:MAG: hypothetical protein A2869_02100 [Candidatus Levybacteria bacterium RIFCSPHIGHO2_01_FULL_40_58]OGH26093.1 MAG: hypothetical protein A3C30_03180 [Candidatus Levybacteria bacterium RIFCSPHIGHO2_02_FULL_40_18]OGH32074.1 MAG: hypothetical protein A3E43_04040 [Candidatus Levybacteria bacterium RIFCSPHIGHO2_12_FULL_40_31]OGH39914.1 MAG: hypothetical protein A2894_02485 [Candidatus Levybacteria bacterium RIFCSPLOWO2_01_FULL_40_64]OGH49568.1 MAG: hypothetical protein A3I54_04965 [Candidatus Lev
MLERRGFNHYFARSSDKGSYRLITVRQNRWRKPEISLGQDKWTSNQARSFARYCQRSDVPTAKERLENHLEAYFLRS